MEPLCQRCSRLIPRRRLENARRVGRQPKYCSLRCQAADKQARYRHKAPKSIQDRIHLRNLVAHSMIAEKLLTDPEILTVAKRNLERWVQQSGQTPALLEWDELLESGDQAAILAVLLSLDEEAMRLRSSSPFTGILNEAERRLIFEATRKG